MGIRIGVLGVGPVGETIIKVLIERKLARLDEIVIMATSERNEHICSEEVEVKKVSEELFKGLDLVFFAGKEGAQGASIAWGDVAIRNGCVVIDNGGDFRMHENIPLVIPEINMDVMTKDTRYICNPNCSTIQLAVALYPLHKLARLRRVIVSTYQSVSGHSGAGIDQLNDEVQMYLEDKPITHNPHIFAQPIAFNCIPHIDRFLENGYTKEEIKMVNETRKIFREPSLLISSTTVRVPVLVGHSESINAEFTEPMNAKMAIEVLSNPSKAPGVVCIDGLSNDVTTQEIREDVYERRYPVVTDLMKDDLKDSVLVGRIRDDMTAPNAINMWCVSDNLRKGAATNAVQIAEEMIKGNLL